MSVIKKPSTNISSFGDTMYIYYVVSRTKNNFICIRENSLIVHKPLIITPYKIEHDEGLNHEIKQFTQDFFNQYLDNARLLGYRFVTTFRENWTEKDHNMEAVLEKLSKQVNFNPMAAIIKSPDKYWQLSALKLFTVVIEQSISINFSEFEERGMFDKDGIPPRVHKEIEDKFNQAKKDKTKIQELGNILVHYNLFDKHEERFFDLISNKNK